jgi:hypothetical protein
MNKNNISWYAAAAMTGIALGLWLSWYRKSKGRYPFQSFDSTIKNVIKMYGSVDSIPMSEIDRLLDLRPGR